MHFNQNWDVNAELFKQWNGNCSSSLSVSSSKKKNVMAHSSETIYYFSMQTVKRLELRWRTCTCKRCYFGWIHLQHTRIVVALACWNFFIVFKTKNNKKFPGQMQQLYAYVANESTFYLLLFPFQRFIQWTCNKLTLYSLRLTNTEEGFTVCISKVDSPYKDIKNHYAYLT